VSEQARQVIKPALNGGAWWLHPAVIFSLPLVITGITAYVTGPSSYLRFWRTQKYFDLSCLGLVFGVVLVFAAGCLLGGARRRGNTAGPTADWKRGIRWQLVRVLFNLSFALTITAYLIWFGVAIKNGLRPSVIYQVLHSSTGTTGTVLEDHLQTIPGVTTATQFGLAVIVLGVPLGAVAGWRRVRWQMIAIFILALMRSFLNSERLAIIELLIPFIVAIVSFRPPKTRRAYRLIQAAPLFGPLVLLFFFAGAEYYRSWATYYSRFESSFWRFISLRLLGYYTTALNNGALLWRVSKPLSTGFETQTLDFIWRFPFVNRLLPLLFPSFGVPALVSDYRYDALLQAAANPELTNPSGVFAPIVDYGVGGGLLYWFLCGLVCGYLYKELKLHKPAGMFLYPLLFVGLTEAARILYWGEGRLFPSMFLLILSISFILSNRGLRGGALPSIKENSPVGAHSLTV
jgi:oligosaccharide repeat unit polymerase